MSTLYPTYGGKQFWMDQYVYAGWRIQQNISNGRNRLLDANDRLHFNGTYNECLRRFAKIYDQLVRQDSIIVLLHGIFRSKDSMKLLQNVVQPLGHPICINYPSFRTNIERLSSQITRVLERLPAFQTLHFVTHSMGGILVRKLFSMKLPSSLHNKLDKVVMIAPPNQGSSTATWLEDYTPLGRLTDQLLMDLRPESVQQLPVPDCDLGVISGGTGTEFGINPFLRGDNDGTVRVESAKIEEMNDFIQVKGQHSCLLRNDRVMTQVSTFLKEGQFKRS